MANTDINTVPLGVAGTGSAYLLGPNTALQSWMGDVKQNQHNRQLQQQRKQANAVNFQKNRFDAQPGKLYNRELQELVSMHMQEGAQAMAKGVNPYNPNYNDPNQAQFSENFLQSEARIKNLMATVQDIEKRQKESIDTWRKDPPSFDYDDYERILNFDKEVSLDDIVSGNADLPVLGKSFNVLKDVVNPLGVMQTTTDVIEKREDGDFTVKQTVPDFERITSSVRSAFLDGGPGANHLVKELRKAGFDSASPDGLLGTTDEQEVRSILDAEFRSPSEFNPIVELMADGKIPAVGSEEYNRFLDQSVREQLRAEKVADGIINNAVKLSASKVNPSFSEKPNFDYNNELRRQRSERRAEETLQIRRNNQESKKLEEATKGTDTSYVGDSEIPMGPMDAGQSVGVKGLVTFRNSTAEFVGGDMISLSTGEPGRTQSTYKAAIAGLGEFPIDKTTGKVVDKENVTNNPNVEYKKMALLREDFGGGAGRSMLVPAERVQSNLTKAQDKIYNEFMSKPAETKPATTKASPTTLSYFK